MLLSFVSSTIRIQETLPCDRFIPRVQELESQGALYWKIKVLPHGGGYEIQCDVPTSERQYLDFEHTP